MTNLHIDSMGLQRLGMGRRQEYEGRIWIKLQFIA